MAGITGGCGGGNYCPETAVTRGQMAVFLERGMNGSSYLPPPATGTVFGDVPTSYWSAAWVEKLFADGITGGCGGGNYSSAPINDETDWDNATVVSTGVPTPQEAGNTEHMTLLGLAEGATYYLAVRAEDDVFNLGNLPDNSTSGIATPDTTTPASIQDLDALPGMEEGTITLSWTAPGDDGASGTAAFYLVRYSASLITDQTDWDNATPVIMGIPTPHIHGTTETMTVAGLGSGSTTYFAVRAQDEVSNLGDLSNSPHATATPDTTPPAAIANLAAVTGMLEGTVDLTWTAPGDNGILGTASSYQVRYAAAAIDTEEKWTAATPVSTGIPTPHAAGTTETMTVDGLTNGTNYYFAVKTLDEIPNSSALSNSLGAVAKTDTFPPAAITDLVATM